MLDGFNGDDDKWGKVYNYEYKINTVLQEIAENDVDQAHFPKCMAPHLSLKLRQL